MTLFTISKSHPFFGGKELKGHWPNSFEISRLNL